MVALPSWLYANGVVWPATATVVISQSINAGVQPQTALAFYWDLSNHKEMHPYVSDVVVDATHSPEQQRFVITEKVPVVGSLGMTLHISGSMAVTSSSPECIELQSSANAPSCYVHHVLKISPTETGCLLQETASFTAPWPLLSFTRRKGVAAHEASLKTMAHILEQQQQQQ